MRLFAAYVSDLHVEFDPAVHCRPENAGYALTMRETEGQVATVEIERRQTGWSILGASQPRCCLISWSPTADPANAILLARGRITGLPDDLFGMTQRLTIECAPADIEERLLDWCKDLPNDGDEVDFLFSDADPESVDTYLLGRFATLKVDPVDHSISLVDDLLGDTVHDLADVAYIVSSGRGVYDPPVRTYRAVLRCDWTQTAEGTVDIAARVKPLGSAIYTLDGGFAGRIESSLSTAGSDGWSTAGGVEVESSVGETSGQPVGSVYEAYQVTMDTDFINQTTRQVYYRRGDIAPKRTRYSLAPCFLQHAVRIRKFPLAYSYSQARQDVCDLALDVPVQDSVAVRDEDAEVFEFTLGDIMVDDSIPEWLPGEAYVAGDRSRFGAKYYQCIADHVASAYFDEDRGIVYSRKIYDFPIYYQTTRTYWLRVWPVGIPSPAAMTAFLSTARGERCIRHALLRLRKEGRRRLRAWHVTLEATWENAHHVRLQDSVSILIPWDDEGAHRRAIGKVVGIERIWDGRSEPMVRFEIGIAFGLGGAPADGSGDNAFVEAGYVDDAYFGSSGESDLEFVVEAPAAVVPVAAEKLRSPNYACMHADVVNEAPAQLAALSDIVSQGADVTEVSVRKPTGIKLRMRPLETTDEPLVRELDVVGQLLVTPSGIDLT